MKSTSRPLAPGERVREVFPAKPGRKGGRGV
jgi:hypothetical protein